jgi:EAL domain-containing protein (putative c-di-GMP-specific phosphodiesterase class I)
MTQELIQASPDPVAFEDWALVGVGNDEEEVQTIPLATSPFRVGRRAGLSLSISSASVSREHAEIIQKRDVLTLIDLGSTNGTYVNGARLTAPHRLMAGDLIHFGDVGFSLMCGQQKRSTHTVAADPSQWVSAMCQFDRLFDDGNAMPFYQPIVALANGSVIGYEVLARSCIKGLEHPNEMFVVADRFRQVMELSRLFRSKGVQGASAFSGSPNLFLNTHPADLGSPQLLPSLAELRNGSQGQPLTLEVHEAAMIDSRSMKELRARLRDLDIGLAYDEFGAGYQRLIELFEVPPDVLKFDGRFVRDIHHAAKSKRTILAGLVKMVRELEVAPLAKCVETREESEACIDLGFVYAQGYYYGAPAAANDLLVEQVPFQTKRCPVE